jgi:hypothetical protein
LLILRPGAASRRDCRRAREFTARERSLALAQEHRVSVTGA